MNGLQKFFIFLVFFSLNSFAQDCYVPHVNENVSCVGTRTVTSVAELESYKTDLGLNNAGTKIRNLKIDFDYDGAALAVSTPCKITVAENRTVKTAGELCFYGKSQIRFESGSRLETTEAAKLNSENSVVFKATSTIMTGGNLELISHGVGEDSRAQVRSEMNITVGGDFILRALRRATIGRDSTVQVTGDLTIISNGDALGESEDDWATIWARTNVSANSINISSTNRTVVARETNLTSNSIYLDGIDCKIHKTAVINATNKTGNCFSGNHPDAILKPSVLGGTAPLQVLFNGDKSTTPEGTSLVKYHWEVEGQGVVTTVIPTFMYTFNTPGEFRVRLQVENSLGLKNSASKKIIVSGEENMPPVANFTITPEEALVGEELVLDASGSTDDLKIKKYKWSLSNGDEITSRDSVLNYTFQEAGTFDISLVVEDILGVDSTVLTKSIEISPVVSVNGPRAFFMHKHNDNYTNFTVTNKAMMGEAGLAEIYYLVNGVRYDNPDLLYGSFFDIADFGLDDVVTITQYVRDENGNTSEYTRTFTINDQDAPVIEGQVVQSDVLTAYLNGSNIFDPYLENADSTLSIDWGDGSSETMSLDAIHVTHVYGSAGTYDVRLRVNTTRGFDTEVIQTVTITDQPVELIPPTSNFLVQVDPTIGHVRLYLAQAGTANGSIVGYTWQMGDGVVYEGLPQIVHFYDPGVYPVTLTVLDSAGQSSSTTQNVVVTESGDPLVIRAFCENNSNNPTVGCFVQTAHRFFDFSHIIIDWGDGTSERRDGTNPYFNEFTGLSHTYTEGGTYTVTITSHTNSGDTKSYSQEVTYDSGGTVNQRPVATINCSSENLEVSCSGLGTYDPDGMIVRYEFTLDGTTFDTSDPDMVYTFNEAGTYTIEMVAYDQLGLGSVPVSTQVTIEEFNSPPNANINCTSPAPYTVTCNASGSEDVDGFITSIDYTFPGGTPETYSAFFVEENITSTFTSAGLKEITLSITDDKGFSSETTVEIDITDNQNPIAVINCTSTDYRKLDCSGSGSSDADGTIANYNWIINGVSYTGVEVSVSDLPGNQATVQLQVVDNLGGTSFVTSVVDIDTNEAPVAMFDCVISGDRSLSCDGSASSDPDGDAITYHWSFYNQFSEGSSTAENSYSSYGTKTVSLIVKDIYGHTNQKTLTFDFINLVDDPVAKIYARVNHELKTVEFDATDATENGRQVSEYEWTYSEGGTPVTTTEGITSHTYSDFGTYTVSLKITDTSGRVAASTKVITISDMPVPDPGDAGFATLEGVDSDLDGIRDDLQRWIIENSETQDILNSFRRLAVINQKIATEGNDNSEAILNLRNLDNEKKCLNSFFESSDLYNELYKVFMTLSFDTRYRLRNYLVSLEEFSGEMVTVETSSTRLSSYCPAN